jgi:hypothetical protein
MELGIRLSFVKTSEFREAGVWTPQTPLGTPLGEVLCGFPQFLQKNASMLSKLDFNRLYLDHFQFIIHPYPTVSLNMSKICQPIWRIYR